MDDTVPLSFSQADITRLLASACLVLISGFISGSEVAFFSITQQDLEKGSPAKASQKLRQVLDNRSLLLAALLTLNTIVNISLVVVSDPLFSRFDRSGHMIQRLLLQVGVVSLVILIFGELIPKIFARRQPLPLALLASRIIWPILHVGRPFFQPLLWISRIMGSDKTPSSPALSRTELSDAMEITGLNSTQSAESRILKGIIDFGDKEVSQIMTPRMQVAGLNYDAPFPEVLEFIRQHGFSRVPVFKGSPDSVAGILFIKDLIPHLEAPPDFDWHTLLHPPFFVPENMTARRLLRAFQEKKIHMALVVDEHGGFSGVVTLEDVIEEVVGEIEDERDEIMGKGQKLGDGLFIFDGATMLSDFLKTCHLPDDYFQELGSPVDSLAGVVIEIAEKIPKPNEEFQYKNISFRVLKADERRIFSLKVRIHPPQSSHP
ncbi:MAG: CNNM domain-containing protein [Flavobacteriales bacterium]|nr:CNNM domain-containing protein [Flavobacteriales bacterium]